jgi:hypothetical protein
MTRFRSADAATRLDGPKATDHDLPIGERTRSGAYLAAIVVVLVIGIALVAFAIVGFTESTSRLENSADAVAPTEQLAPETTGSILLPQSADANLDRDIQPSTPVEGSDDPALAVPGVK